MKKYKNFTIKRDCYFGWQDCPFGCADELRLMGSLPSGEPSISSSLDYHISLITPENWPYTDVKTGEDLFFSELHPHLIKDHHFFEGNTKYRSILKNA
jgi:hypothetical protein